MGPEGGSHLASWRCPAAAAGCWRRHPPETQRAEEAAALHRGVAAVDGAHSARSRHHKAAAVGRGETGGGGLEGDRNRRRLT